MAVGNAGESEDHERPGLPRSDAPRERACRREDGEPDRELQEADDRLAAGEESQREKRVVVAPQQRMRREIREGTHGARARQVARLRKVVREAVPRDVRRLDGAPHREEDERRVREPCRLDALRLASARHARRGRAACGGRPGRGATSRPGAATADAARKPGRSADASASSRTSRPADAMPTARTVAKSPSSGGRPRKQRHDRVAENRGGEARCRRPPRRSGALPEASVIAAPAVRIETVAARGFLAKRIQSTTNATAARRAAAATTSGECSERSLRRVGLDERHRPQDEQHGEADDERRRQPSRARV